MIQINETAQLLAYQPALWALALLCLIVLIQNALTAPFAFLKKEQSPGKALKGNHKLFSFRVLRTHVNSVESLAPFGLTVLLGIVVSANINALNWLAMAHVFFRLCFWFVYYSGIGKVAGGPRTLCFVGGLTTNIALVIIVMMVLI